MTAVDVLLTVVMIYSAVVTVGAREVIKRNKDLVDKLDERRLHNNTLQTSLEESKQLGNRLLAANDELAVSLVTDEVVNDYLKKNPNVISQQQIEAVLRSNGVAHSWREAGNRIIPVVYKEAGRNVTRKYKLRTDVCRTCRTEHQYFVDGGHDSVTHMEGFYLAGTKLTAGHLPRCTVLPAVTVTL